MKVNCRIRFEDDESTEIAKFAAYSLRPDNLSSMCTEVDEYGATTYFYTEKITTIISSLDDFLMNTKIAEDVYTSLKKN
ncbi:KEOPS complex subunit Pcc1 [Methanohalobium sp.]|uniref:KEOPS complex subunit Pcc1 n=1 Tax=Methanohalobium sp. TaxID=2837493 RepID=UPI0025E7527B|nr:KEOPS complex subunit Pcc1 [Methanohalobium sp.]